MDVIVERPAALDVHKEQVTACVRVPGKGGARSEEIAQFRTTVQGLLTLHDWLAATQSPEQPLVVLSASDQHHLERLGRRHQHLRRIRDNPASQGIRGVAVPELHAASQQTTVVLQPGMEVVQQCSQRTDVHDAETGPALGQHSREHREHGGFGLSARCWRQQQCVIAAEKRADGLFLKRAKRRPAETVDDVVLNGWVEIVEGAHVLRSMSSTVAPPLALRSIAVISGSASVNA